jgi:hypothetical protein
LALIAIKLLSPILATTPGASGKLGAVTTSQSIFV